MTGATPLAYIVPAGLPSAALWGAACALTAAWIGSYFVSPRHGGGGGRIVMGLLRAAIGCAALVALAQASERIPGMILASEMVWPLALCAAVVVQAAFWLYALERRTVPRRTGRAIIGLRILLVLLVAIMFAQPVLHLQRERTVQRQVAVLVDVSASMDVRDTNLSTSEQLRLAELVVPDLPKRPYRMEEIARHLHDAREALDGQLAWLSMLAELDPEAREARIRIGREDLQQAMKRASTAAAEQLASIEGVALAPETEGADALAALRTSLGSRVLDALRAAESAAEAGDFSQTNMQEMLAAASAALRQAGVECAAVGAALDEAYCEALSPGDCVKLRRVTEETRRDIARRVLVGGPEREAGVAGSPEREAGAPVGLLDRLGADYLVKTGTFALTARDARLPADLAPRTPPPGENGKEEPDAERLSTDIAAALEKVITDTPAERLAGVVLLTDGRHNTRGRAEPLARKLGVQDVPVSTVVIGSENPPRDAAIVSLQAPDTVFAGDTVYLAASLKLDGLEGRTAHLSLSHKHEGSDEPAQVVDTLAIPISSPRYRTRVELAHTPKQTGRALYTVRVDEFDDEVFTDNNTFPVGITVTDERTKLLIIEQRPRWEFRYLKNLFLGRDKTVQMQYVLVHPETIAEMPPLPRVPASVSRPLELTQATAPPENEAEWLRFDVVILGDVAPAMLQAADREALRKFVVDRGGTLVVVAGPNHMPHAYAGTRFEDLLPVRFAPSAQDYIPPPESGYRLALTREGHQNLIMRQVGTREESLAIWRAAPAMHWRYPIRGVKPGATTLAYAVPDGKDYDSPPDEAVQRQHALVVTQDVALGRVMFLAFDRTWRLRHRAGDKYHHKFWGQIMRWATANKLPAGTELVKLGTDRSRYPMHSRVQVRARITQPDLTPLVSQEVAVALYRDGRLMMRRALTYVGDVPGMYNADLGELPSGAYRVQLDCPPVADILAGEGVDAVATEFSIDRASPAEQVELAADRGLPGSLAAASGGILVGPADAARVVETMRESVLKEDNSREIVIWSSWPLLGAMLLLATSEWLLRKRVGLP